MSALRTANDDSYPSAMRCAISIGMPSASMSAGNHWLLSGTKGLRIAVSLGHPEAIPAGKATKVAHPEPHGAIIGVKALGSLK